MTDKELNAAVQAAFAANPEAKQFHVIATGDCFTNELDARHAARQLGEHERGVRVVTRDGVKGIPSDDAAMAAPVVGDGAPVVGDGAPVVGDGASDDADGDGGAGSINAEEEAAVAAPKKSAKKKK
ncbi:MAG: hypothetical protein JST38_08720 [Bacteroidetes bacterium]|nr:hypothetical protein [Bacteroidota bacterium]